MNRLIVALLVGLLANSAVAQSTCPAGLKKSFSADGQNWFPAPGAACADRYSRYIQSIPPDAYSRSNIFKESPGDGVCGVRTQRPAYENGYTEPPVDNYQWAIQSRCDAGLCDSEVDKDVVFPSGESAPRFISYLGCVFKREATLCRSANDCDSVYRGNGQIAAGEDDGAAATPLPANTKDAVTNYRDAKNDFDAKDAVAASSEASANAVDAPPRSQPRVDAQANAENASASAVAQQNAANAFATSVSNSTNITINNFSTLVRSDANADRSNADARTVRTTAANAGTPGGGNGGSGNGNGDGGDSCGLPNTPPCKIDETGTLDGKGVDTKIKSIEDALDAAKNTYEQNKKTSLGWTLGGLNLGGGSCQPFAFGTQVTVDICPWLSMVRTVLAWFWMMCAAVYVWRTTREGIQ